MTPSGYTLYEGPSRLVKGANALAILTLHSENVKTGDMPQVWIMDRDTKPTDASLQGLDESVCGNCGLRPFLAKGTGQALCYVNLGQAPNGVWKKWNRGGYPALPRRDWLIDRPVRIGAYGDPAAVPLKVWKRFLKSCPKGWTAYTHQWRRFPGLRHFCMASVDTRQEQKLAVSHGWRTFRVQPKVEEWLPKHWYSVAPNPYPPLQDMEITCPASDEAGHRTTCFKCRLCDGKGGPHDRRKNITIQVH